MPFALPPPPSVRRVLGAAALVAALALTGAPSVWGVASAVPVEECKPDDQECKDKETNANEAKEIDQQQTKTKEAAAKADKDIAKIGKDLEECTPGSDGCMSKLAKGNGEKEGLADMTATVKDFRTEPGDNAQSAVTSTCEAFPASLPAGSADPGQSPFPVSQLCSLLGS
ncbi:hypothetical protein AB0G79_26085 [Streptomyces sp. NPDC020807]|uniref:hypothetical protein n=1 Tax=Streptomyces sp. NPDC020807 TaxID=3155119 RepID=UPI0033D9722F